MDKLPYPVFRHRPGSSAGTTQSPVGIRRTRSTAPRHAVFYIQDKFNEAGIEILSPHYRAQRDGNMITIPEHYLPSDYQVPSFRVEQQVKPVMQPLN